MSGLSKKIFTFSLLSIPLMSVGTSVSAAPVYMAERIPLGVGNNRAIATAINDAGFVTGYGFLQSASRADREGFIWNGQEVISLGIDRSRPRAINNSNTIVGTVPARISGSGSPAFQYSNGERTYLDYIPDGAPRSTSELYLARAINDAGTVVGAYSTVDGVLSWITENGTARTLGLNISVNDINNSGLSVGTTTQQDVRVREAFIHDGSSYTTIGTLEGKTSSIGVAINDSGWVTGTSGLTTELREAFVYDGDSMFSLGLLDGFGTVGNDINNAGWVVGRTDPRGDSVGTGFLYDGEMVHDLNSLVVNSSIFQYENERIDSAIGINNNGDIIVRSSVSTRTGASTGVNYYRLTNISPVPLPASAWLFGTALLGFFGARLRNKNS